MIPCLKIYPQISKKFTVLLRGVFFVAMFFLLLAESPQAQTFGTGADGSVDITTTVHLSADMNYINLLVSASGVIETHGYTIYVQGTLINYGTIRDSFSGGNGGLRGNGGDGGHGYYQHVYSTVGGNGVNGSGPSVSGGGQGGTGGGGGGGGGGAWDEDDGYSASGGNGGNGGNGGQGGGVVNINTKVLVNYSLIHTDGFNGNNGTPGQSGQYRSYTENVFWSRDLGGGGGGGGSGGIGGNGGRVQIIYSTILLTGTIRSDGGSSGSGSSGGSGVNTSYSAGSSSYSESGSTGGSPGGGNGGQGTRGSGSSSSGTPGSPGSTGSSGTVTLIPATLCYVDADGDGFGSVSDPGSWTAGGCGAGFSMNNLDCDDGDPTVNPSAPEIVGDGIDQDCDGFDACYVDGDGDGYGSNSVTTGIDLTCTGVGESPNNLDCNDAVASIYPGAPEVPDDGIDQDCNGSDAVTCIVDADMDGFGTDAGTVVIAGDGSCDAAQQESTNDTDCDDSDPAINPDATEILDDGIDQDCDGSDATCCGLFTSGQTGNTNCDTDGKRNLADITRLIDNVYISKVALCCPRNGNTNGDVLNKINLADITRLIDNVYISKDETAPCN